MDRLAASLFVVLLHFQLTISAGFVWSSQCLASGKGANLNSNRRVVVRIFQEIRGTVATAAPTGVS